MIQNYTGQATSTNQPFCYKIKEQLKKSYDMIVYSDKKFGCDPEQKMLIEKLAESCRILFVHPSEDESSLEIKNDERFSVLSFGRKHFTSIWNKLPDYICNTTVSAFVFFSPLYSLLKRVPCNKVIYISDPGLSDEARVATEPYIIQEASLVLNRIEPDVYYQIRAVAGL